MYLICLIFVLPKVVCVNPVWGPVYSELGPVVDSVIYIYIIMLPGRCTIAKCESKMRCVFGGHG